MIKAAPPLAGIALLAGIAGIAGLAGPARADGDYTSPTDDRVRATLGVMHVSTGTTLRVDSSTGVPGSTLSGERDFGLDRSDFEPKFQIMFRGGERNRLWLDYFMLDRSGSIPISSLFLQA